MRLGPRRVKCVLHITRLTDTAWNSPYKAGPGPVIVPLAVCNIKITHIVRKVAAFLSDTSRARVST